MEVVVVIGIVIGGEHGLKHATGAVAHLAQELPLDRASVPAIGDTDDAPVHQREAGNVDGVADGVLA